MLMCHFVLHGICLLTFSHDAVQIAASPELIAVAQLIVNFVVIWIEMHNPYQKSRLI